jgi:hypothetical protein
VLFGSTLPTKQGLINRIQKLKVANGVNLSGREGMCWIILITEMFGLEEKSCGIAYFEIYTRN